VKPTVAASLRCPLDDNQQRPAPQSSCCAGETSQKRAISRRLSPAAERCCVAWEEHSQRDSLVGDNAEALKRRVALLLPSVWRASVSSNLANAGASRRGGARVSGRPARRSESVDCTSRTSSGRTNKAQARPDSGSSLAKITASTEHPSAEVEPRAIEQAVRHTREGYAGTHHRCAGDGPFVR
jgi:hypothetical protein